jgi:hypothetical protein
MGLLFANCSWREGFTGFFPALTASANLLFRWRISNSVGWGRRVGADGLDKERVY